MRKCWKEEPHELALYIYWMLKIFYVDFDRFKISEHSRDNDKWNCVRKFRIFNNIFPVASIYAAPLAYFLGTLALDVDI